MHELDHKANGAECPYRHNTHILHLYQPFCSAGVSCQRSRCQLLIASLPRAPAYSSLLVHATNKTYGSTLCFIISSGYRGGGWERRGAHIRAKQELNAGARGDKRCKPVFMSEQENGMMGNEYGYQQRLHSPYHLSVTVQMHAGNKLMIRVHIKSLFICCF